MVPSEDELQTILDTIPALAWAARPDGSAEFFNRPWLDYTGLSAEQARDWTWTTAIHPDDLNGLTDYWRSILDSGEPGEFEARLRRFDGEYRWFLFRASPLRDRSGTVVKWYGTNTDIDDQKRAEDELRASEHNFRLIVDSIPGLVCTMSAVGEVEFLNRRVLEYFGKTVEELKGWATGDVIHPDDLPRVIATFTNSVAAGQPYGLENRYRRADGSYRWFEFRALPARDAAGRILRWYALLIDIDDRKQTEEKLRESEAVLLEAQQLSHTGSWMHDPATGRTWQSPELLRIFGVNPNEEDASSGETFIARIHPEDAPIEAANYARAQEAKKDFEGDYRIVLLDGSIRRIHNVAHPKLDESGNLIGYVGIAMDVTEQWQARTNLERAFEEIKILKDRLHDENLALREQIDQGFMFEEIVGSSPALQRVLSSVVSVAPTDSTVLITGETGTGKELIARAIHKRSQRAGQAFISVNCASIPTSLIASELFGHEKGAFTGALQRRQGRFELAHSGTIFLDEIGELPAETQVTLLRVLQEREFERVGGSRVLKTDVRVVAATNRHLPAAVAAGTFRADLYYRLNVFPIPLPSLRERREDIPILVEYFVKRYAEKARKLINKIDKNTLTLCQSYHWPGNIRELQNIIERSVILCKGDTFWVDPAWLSGQEATPTTPGPLMEKLQIQEKEIIEAALAQSKGKVAGPDGAAVKLGIPRSTLDWKIKQLKIRKYRLGSESE